MRGYATVGLLIVTMAAGVAAEDQQDPVVCTPTQAPIVFEHRTDGRVVAHVEFAAPLPTSCSAFRVAALRWSVERCDAEGVCDLPAFRNSTYACPFLPRFPDRRCVDAGRIVFRPRGAGLYNVRLEAVLMNGSSLRSSTLLRVGRRPSRLAHTR